MSQHLLKNKQYMIFYVVDRAEFWRADGMSKREKYIDIGDVEDFIEQTYHELIYDADKYRNYCKEILRQTESISMCNQVKIKRIKEIIKKYKKNPELYKSKDVLNTIEIILYEKGAIKE